MKFLWHNINYKNRNIRNRINLGCGYLGGSEQAPTDEMLNIFIWRLYKMTQVKKAFQPIVDLIENAIANDSKVKASSLLADIIALAAAKVSTGVGSTILKSTDGTVVAVRCYYFKRWMPLVGDKAVEFGKKANTATGLNTMCKEGSSHWTKQQRDAEAANKALMTKVISKEITPDDIPALQAQIEETRKLIVPTELGFATEEEVREYLSQTGVVLA